MFSGFSVPKTIKFELFFDRVIQKNEKGGFFSEQFTD